jgi:general secretion pathway protein F
MRYELKALRGTEGLSAIALDAADSNDAMAQAAARGYTVVSVKAAGPSWVAGWSPRKPDFPLVQFSQELLALLEAGLALVEALETLAEKELRSGIRKILMQIVSCLYEGHPLSYALEQSEAKFPQLYVATVRASEKTGALQEGLTRYIAYHSQVDGVKRKVISASIYPAVLAGGGSLVSIFLMVYVVPRFSRIYEDIGSDLPFMSRLLIRWGVFLEEHGVLLLGIVLSMLAALVYTATRPRFRQWLLLQLWEMPAIGTRLHRYQLAGFYRSLGMLLRGGMPVLPSLQMVSGLLQVSLRGQLSQAATSIREGHAISESMERYGLTTPVAFRMLRVGEQTGRMGEMMERIAAFYEDETAQWVERFTKLFEPLLMAFIGLLIGGIVVLMYFPIFELAGSLQ